MTDTIHKSLKNDDLDEIIIFLWSKKYFISKITFLFATLSIVISLTLPNIYASKAILAGVNIEESLSSKLGNLSTLASFSGVDFENSNTSKINEAIQRMSSLEFFSNYFLPNINLEDMMAVKKWDQYANKIIYNKSKFDETEKKWVRDVSFPKSIIPSDQEAYEVYKDIISIYKDEDTNFIFLSVKHKSPYITKEWADIIIFNLNESMRAIDILEAEKAVAFLDNSSQLTNNKDLKESIAGLLEDQMQTLMLASSKEHYVLKIIDSPTVPEKKASPNRSLICILITIIGFIFSVLLSFLNRFIKQLNL